MLAELRPGVADVVVAVDLDRFLHDTRDLISLVDTGARALTVDGEIDLTTADGEFRATMLAGIARFEVHRKSERQRRPNESRPAPGRRRYGSSAIYRLFNGKLEDQDQPTPPSLRDNSRRVQEAALVAEKS